MSKAPHPDVFGAALNLSSAAIHLRHKNDALLRACAQHGVLLPREAKDAVESLRLRCVEVQMWIDDFALPSTNGAKS